MTAERTPRDQLHDFLQAARARLQPEDVGIKPASNRRGSGLHQADIADALIVSDRWYNGFENGTAGPARNGQLDKLASILRLTATERVCLFLLAADHEPPGSSESPPLTAASRGLMTRLLGLLGPDLPAVLCDIAWNMLAWNPAMTERIAGPGPGRAADPNVIEWLFTDEAGQILGDIGHARETGIGQVHLALARDHADPLLQTLVARLLQIPAARRLWDLHRISDEQVISPRQVRIPGGEMREADLVTLQLPGRLRLLTLVPRNGWQPGPPPGGSRRPRPRPSRFLPAT